MSAGIVGWNAGVFTIFGLRANTKIDDAVIGPRSVDVIDLAIWPLSMAHCPYNAVGVKPTSMDTTKMITVLANGSERFAARPLPAPLNIVWSRKPKKLSGVWVAAKQLTKFFDRR